MVFLLLSSRTSWRNHPEDEPREEKDYEEGIGGYRKTMKKG